MANLLTTAPYRGTRDFLPAEMSVRHQVFEKLYRVIEAFGYQRYDGPLLESAEIYEAKSGRELAEMQLYTLTDRGGRRLALRPEMTPTVARMIAANASGLQFPVRWYSHPNCFRYERPQRGRVREHWQINVDIFGTGSPRAEIEVFNLIHEMMAALGANKGMYRLRVSDRGLLDAVLTDVVRVPAALIAEVSSLIDRWEKSPIEQLREDARALGLDDDTFARLSDALVSGADVLKALPRRHWSPHSWARSSIWREMTFSNWTFGLCGDLPTTREQYSRSSTQTRRTIGRCLAVGATPTWQAFSPRPPFLESGLVWVMSRYSISWTVTDYFQPLAPRWTSRWLDFPNNNST